MEEMKLPTFASGFKDVFKRERKKAGYTQQSFADYFDIGIDTVRNWEQGRTVPEIKTLERLCDEFGCDLDYLLGRMGNSTHNLELICKNTGLDEDSVIALNRVKDDPAQMTVLNFLIANGSFLQKIVLYFASAFWDIERHCELRTLPFDRRQVDSRLFSADAHDGITTGREYFYEIYKNDQDISRQMILCLLRSCTAESDIDQMQQFMFDHKDDEPTPELSIIADFLLQTGDADFMRRAGCDMERFTGIFKEGENADNGTN